MIDLIQTRLWQNQTYDNCARKILTNLYDLVSYERFGLDFDRIQWVQRRTVWA